MFSSLVSLLATFNDPPPTAVPDSGSSAFLLTAAVLGVGLLARFIKNRKR